MTALDWKSSLTLEQVFQSNEVISYPTPWANGVLFLTTISEPKPRATLVYRPFDRSSADQVMVPEPFNLRTRISEYGGKPFWLFGSNLVFVNDDDQCLYRCCLTEPQIEPQKLTEIASDGEQLRYGDVVAIGEHDFLAITEHVIAGQHEPACYLSHIKVGETPAIPSKLYAQADFLSNLVVDQKNQRIAWVQWNHPNMPWDETQLFFTGYALDDKTISLAEPQQIALEQSASVCQLLMLGCGDLVFVADFVGYEADDYRNYWNLYRVDLDHPDQTPEPISKELAEFGYPHWQFGDARIASLDETNLLAIATDKDTDVLYQIDLAEQSLQRIESAAVGFHSLCQSGNGRALLMVSYADRAPELVEFVAQSSTFRTCFTAPIVLPKDEISVAQHFSYQTSNDSIAYAFYYPPVNTNHNHNQPPPLLVMVHGGPTARANGAFDLQKQFWTQRGFAILDVNHRGSCGYGRDFRDALYGGWGVMDADDVINAISALVEQDLAQQSQVCIRGKSAGGYAVLRALTEYPEVFKVGACYYGIGNLETLAEDTHKFESHYTDRLLGEAYDAETAKLASSEYYLRSPINFVDRLSSAMIVFQGAQDKVVPPSVAHEIITALKAQNVAHKYVEYADEGHGFRQAKVNIDAWQQELKFYQKYLP